MLLPQVTADHSYLWTRRGCTTSGCVGLMAGTRHSSCHDIGWLLSCGTSPGEMERSAKIYALSAESLALIAPDFRWIGFCGKPGISHGKYIVKPPEMNGMEKAEYPSTTTLPHCRAVSVENIS